MTMFRARIKFCGITNAADARAAANAGADAIGMVFYAPAPVAVDAQTAQGIMQALPPFVCGVALFVNADADDVWRIVKEVSPHLLQFHGDEDAAYCRSFGVPYIKACKVAAAGDVEKTCAAHPHAKAVLADSKVEGAAGGSGKVFDWSLLPQRAPLPLILAGGLTPENVGDALRKLKPFGVDVSSGIAEDNDRRRKNRDKMLKFAQAAREAGNDNR